PLMSVLAFSADGASLACGIGSAHAGLETAASRIEVRDGQRLELVESLPCQALVGIAGLAFSPDGSRIASGGTKSLLMTATRGSWSQARVPAHDTEIAAVLYRADAESLVTLSSSQLKLWPAHVSLAPDQAPILAPRSLSVWSEDRDRVAVPLWRI